MHRGTGLMVMGLVTAGLAGCTENGLSPREGSTSYAQFVTALYAEPGPATAPAPAVSVPLQLAVAQVGEVAPAREAIEYLRLQTQMFGRVEGIPGDFDERVAPEESIESQRQRARWQVERLMRLARDVGMTHLFMYGGSVDRGTSANALALFDVTIVGAYVAPGWDVKALAKGSGALIDLSSERVVFIASAEQEGKALTTLAGAEGAEQKVLLKLRTGITTRLAEELVAETGRRTGVAVVHAGQGRPSHD